jgi:sugar lactone lactonase YvrE
MSTTLRAALLGGLILVIGQTASSQTMELIAGSGRYVEVPASSISFATNLIARGPDNRFYVSNVNGNFIRFDPALGTVTALPANESAVNLHLNGANAIAFDANGALHVNVSFSLRRIDPAEGEVVDVGSLPFTVRQMVFAPDGTLYFVVTQDSRVRARLPSGAIVVIAGTGVIGFSGDGGPAIDAQLHGLYGIALGPDGDLYVSDGQNHRIRKISLTTGIITTFAGTGSEIPNGNGHPALSANLTLPRLLAFDAAGNLFVADTAARIRRIDSVTGIVTTAVGHGVPGYNGDGGLATAAEISMPKSLAFDAAGNLYFSDTANGPDIVRRVAADTGVITRALGADPSNSCGENVPARFTCFGHAAGLSFDFAGNLLITDSVMLRVHKLDAATNLVSTLAPTPSLTPAGIDHDASGNAYFASIGSHRIGRIDAYTNTLTRYAGTGASGFAGDGGIATAAQFATPTDVTIDAVGNIYIADRGNNRIRKIDATGIVSTLATFTGPMTVELDASGYLLVAGAECRIRRINVDTGASTTVAGTGNCALNDSTLAGPAISTPIGQFTTFTIAPDGSIFLGWSRHFYRLDASGWMTRVPAPPNGIVTADGVNIFRPEKMKFDAAGRLYLTDVAKPYLFRISGLIDATPPVVEPQVSGSFGENGWHRSDVNIEWSVTDPDSTIATTSGCAASTVYWDTSGVTFSCSATSLGGTTTRTVTIRRDATPPVVEFGTMVPPRAGGWATTDVSVPFTVNDATSGVANVTALSPITISIEGRDLFVPFDATDEAGNVSSVTTPLVSIDKTPPVITITSPQQGRTYGAYSDLVTNFSCVDALWADPYCGWDNPPGTALPTNTPGPKAYGVIAYDPIGNIATSGVTYTVAALVFERFIEPLRRSPTFNGVTAGSLVPIRWRMFDGTGQVVTNPAAFQSFTMLNLTCQGTAVPLNDTATGGAGLSVNPANGYFTYNWQTDASWAGTCRRVQIRLGDNSVKEVVFRLN